MWNKIKLFFKNIFCHIYKKPLISVDDLENLVSMIDANKDKYVSANELWDFIQSILSKKK